MLALHPKVVEMHSEGSPSSLARVEKVLMREVLGRSSATTRHVLMLPRSSPFSWKEGGVSWGVGRIAG